MRAHRLLSRIAKIEPALQRLDDAGLLEESLSLRYLARCGEDLTALLPRGFALVREAARRTIRQRHYDVQLLAGIALMRGEIAEMQAGEGKTLTAILPLALHAMAGRGAHLATANPYLADRDAEWMRPVFERLGLTVGVVLPSSTHEERLRAYNCDITYGTVSEFGFDFLRDRLYSTGDGNDSNALFAASNSSGYRPVQRRHHFALVDEADSVLIDDAGMPMIIGTPTTAQRATDEPLYRWAANVAGEFEAGIDFNAAPGTNAGPLTTTGRERVRNLGKPPELNGIDLIEIYEAVERAIAVARRYESNRQYVVDDGRAVIIDENTGRPAEGRSWRGGIHQAVEAKEGLALTDRTDAAASITVQSYFRRYRHLAGLTATASESAREFRQVYGLRIRPIPLHRPSARRKLPARCDATSQEKREAILDEIDTMRSLGRPVLVGTRSIRDSEELSEALRSRGVEHVVLNAINLAREAEIVANAGRAGHVTVATNMAGRGTDILLDADARDAGGLHVIATELHDSARIDRQLYGRCGRHGDPGTYRQFLSLEDRILSEAGAVTALSGTIADSEHPRWLKLFRRVQRSLEARHARHRKLLVRYDDQREQRERELGLDATLEVVDSQ